MSDSSNGSGAGGSLLRGVALDPRPVVLSAPGHGIPATASAGATGGPPPVSVPVESSPGYQEGLRAGLAQGEAAQRARDDSAVAAVQRRAFEQGLEEGRQKGIMEGRELGRAAVERDGKAALDAAAGRLAQLDRLLASLPMALTRRLAEAEEDMVALCHAIVCRILGDELRTPAGVAQLVRQAIREGGLAGLGKLAIHIHPRDWATLAADDSLAERLARHAGTGPVQWVADEHVVLGGCLIQSAEGTLDARLETQLRALGAVLATSRPTPAVEVGAAPPAEGPPGATA